MAQATPPPAAPSRKRRLRRWLLLAGGGALLVWFGFLDTYSLHERIQQHREVVTLREENARLHRTIADLEAALAQPVTDEVIERIAREEYGMRRPGETVYPVATGDE